MSTKASFETMEIKVMTSKRSRMTAQLSDYIRLDNVGQWPEFKANENKCQLYKVWLAECAVWAVCKWRKLAFSISFLIDFKNFCFSITYFGKKNLRILYFEKSENFKVLTFS